jgi:hypothetical protein
MTSTNVQTSTNKALNSGIMCVQAALHKAFVTTDEVNTRSYSYKYVSLPELLIVVTPLLHENGLIATFNTALDGAGNVINVSITHVETDVRAVASWNLGMSPNDFKVSGGNFTYYFRRLLMALLGIHPEDDETEQEANSQHGGYQASQKPPMPPMPPMPQRFPQGVPQGYQGQQAVPQAVPQGVPQMPPPVQQNVQQQQPVHMPSAPPQFQYTNPPQ